MGNIIHQVLYQPIWNALIFIYQYLAFHDFGIAIILLTILVRGLMYPMTYKNAKDQAIIQKLNPKIQEIQKEHKEDKTKQAEKIMALYKEHKVNPGSIFLSLFVQIVIFFNLYAVFQQGTSPDFKDLYSFIPRPEIINQTFVGLFDLTKPNWWLIIITAGLQFVFAKISAPSKEGMNAQMRNTQNIMLFLMPVLTIIFLRLLPSAIAIYWLTTSAFSAAQQLIINKSLEKNGGITKLS